MTNQKMTKEQAFQRAKSIVLISMTNNLRAEDVSNMVAFFGADPHECNALSDLERIEGAIDALIDRLNYMKVNVESAKTIIKDAE